MRRGARVVPSAVLAALLLGWTLAGAEVTDVAPLIDSMTKAYAGIAQYTATLIMRERIGGKLGDPEVIRLKFRKPDSVYMRWVHGRQADREIIVVKDRDEGRALIREPGLLGQMVTIVIAPDHPRVLEKSRHPITDVGLGRLIELVQAGARSATTADVKELPAPGGATVQIEFTSPRPAGACACRRAVFTVDAATLLPVGAETFDPNDALLGSYKYSDVDLTPQLSDADFDSRNPSYTFSIWRWVY